MLERNFKRDQISIRFKFFSGTKTSNWMIRDSNKFPSQDSDVSQDSKIGADIAQFSAGWTTWNRAGLQESCCKRCKFVRYARSRVRPIADRQISFREQREDIDASLIYPRYSYFSLSLSLSLSPAFSFTFAWSLSTSLDTRYRRFSWEIGVSLFDVTRPEVKVTSKIDGSTYARIHGTCVQYRPKVF